MASDGESEYEYEYSQSQTENFYIDLDLTSVNNLLRSENAGERQKLKAPGKQANQDKNDNDGYDATVTIEADNDEIFDEHVPSSEVVQGSEPQGPQLSTHDDSNHAHGDGVQILELHSYNPIVSYRNQIYSCNWTDMVGTNMFFAKHNEAPLHDPDLATEDYDLVGTSRIKLVGQRAAIIPKSGAKKRSRPTDTGDEEQDLSHVQTADATTSLAETSFLPSHYDANSAKRATAQATGDTQRQAAFLEKLKAIKKRRGERDRVRTFVDRHTVEVAGKKEEKQKIRREIDRLNQRVVRGDTRALARLQEIYADMEEEEGESDDPYNETEQIQSKTQPLAVQHADLLVSGIVSSSSSVAPGQFIGPPNAKI